MSREEPIGDRAAAAAGVIGGRALVVVGIGLVVNTLLARLLTPEDFGVVALGTAIVAAGTLLTSGGIAPSLIVRAESPSAAELSAVTGIVLAITAVIVAATAAVALPLGRDGAVVALMVASLPLYAFRVPATIALERELSYSAVARAELTEALAFYTWSLATVAAGFGVWGLASGVIVRAGVGSVALIRSSPARLPRPTLAWQRTRPLIAPGLAFQGSTLVQFGRDQGLNVGIAAIGGLATLGVWSLAHRVLQIPYLMFRALWRVSFPAMARLLASGGDPRPAVEGSARVVAVATGFVLCPLAGGVHALLPPLVGPGWEEVPDLVLLASLGIAAAAPQSVAVTGLLVAAGRARALLVSSVVQATVWLTIGLGLLPSIGVISVALGWMGASAVGLLTLGIPARRLSGARLEREMAVPVGFTLLGCAAGYLVGTSGEPSVALGLLAASAALAVLVTGLVVAARPALRQTVVTVRRALRGTA